MNQSSVPASPRRTEKLIPVISRLLVWGGVFAVFYILRSFFLLLFLTGVFGYIQSRGAEKLQAIIPHRATCVVLVAGTFLGVLIMAGIFLVPRAKDQTMMFVTHLPQYVERLDQELTTLGQRYPQLASFIPELDPVTNHNGSGLGKSQTAILLQQALGLGEVHDGQHKMNQMLDLVRGVGGRIASIASAFLLALLFSFLIVLDLPRLTKSVRSLEQSRLSFVYCEVAGNMRDFAQVLGRALEAQFMIAVVNSLLTAVGLLLLGLGSALDFLVIIVFLCSFIPVLGVFISSVPICLIALQTSGLGTMVLSILMITAVHMIEGYVLNPRIYGTYMRINPVIVLVILTIGAKLFHVWGLILGVPVCTYIFGLLIQKPDNPDILEPCPLANPQAELSPHGHTAHPDH